MRLHPENYDSANDTGKGVQLLGGYSKIHARTHSKPEIHLAMSVVWAHAPKTRREASGMTFAREAKVMVITGENRLTEELAKRGS